jgi:hypothetical protein
VTRPAGSAVAAADPGARAGETLARVAAGLADEGAALNARQAERRRLKRGMLAFAAAGEPLSPGGRAAVRAALDVALAALDGIDRATRPAGVGGPGRAAAPEDVEWLLDRGVTPATTARMLGVKRTRLLVLCARAGREDLCDRLVVGPVDWSDGPPRLPFKPHGEE